MRLWPFTFALVVGLSVLTAQVASAQQVKTAGQCSADYAANKPAIRAAKIRKKDFVASCRAGNETIPGSAAAQAPAPAPAAPPTPVAAAPAAPSLNPFRRKTVTPASVPAASGTPSAANESASAAQANSRCPGATVVWVNLKSGVYHFAGNRTYGNTKAGAYMCETDATGAGDRAARNEKHP